MIGFLTGSLYSKESAGQTIVLVNGVGYIVSVPATYLQSLKESDEVKFYVYTHVREDTLDLYGFLTQDELLLFKLVLSVSGIGPKTALLVIDRGSVSIKQAIVDANTDFFITIPRLGLKNAQKIIIELKNKLGGLKDINLAQENQESLQAIEALRVMGYTRKEALDAISTVPASEQKVEQKISFALRQLGKSKDNL